MKYIIRYKENNVDHPIFYIKKLVFLDGKIDHYTDIGKYSLKFDLKTARKIIKLCNMNDGFCECVHTIVPTKAKPTKFLNDLRKVIGFNEIFNKSK